MELLFSIIYVAAIGILAHYIGESLPRSWFDETKFPFAPYRFEKNGDFYDKIKIKSWKTKLPDMSRIMKDMLPKKITYKSGSENIQALIKETCVAEFIHKALSVFSIGVYFIWKNSIGVVLVIVCVVCNLPFIIIQRYNRPHLIELKNRIAKREEKKRRALTDSVM